MLFSTLAFSQTGIGTSNPLGMLHVDGAKDNPATGSPSAAQMANDFTVTPTGNVGVGTIAPTSKLEVNSGAPNTSGLKLTNLTSATPVSAGATLGVNAVGNVVTVPGAFAPLNGEANGSYTFPEGSTDLTNYNLANITLPAAGTYLISYRVAGNYTVNSGSIGAGVSFVDIFLSTAPSAGNQVPSTQLFVTYLQRLTSPTSQGYYNTAAGTKIVTVTGPTTYYLGVHRFAGGLSFNGQNLGQINYVKIAP
jgi:hypothetical protein